MPQSFMYGPLPQPQPPRGEKRPFTKAIGLRPGAFALLPAESGTFRWQFALWAPNAVAVSLVGDFNDWQAGATPMHPAENGLWAVSLVLPVGANYKYAIRTWDGKTLLRADPCAFYAERRPNTASRTWTDRYKWNDGAFRKAQRETAGESKPMFIYEVHLGSWRQDDGAFYNYSRIADILGPYVLSLGATHVELLPITEHPLDASWGYQTTGYFAPTSRYGNPADFKAFVDKMHGFGLGVILDWVPAHFPRDAHGLRQFDGTPLFEYANEAFAMHSDWGTLRFDLGKEQVRDFLIASALFWLSEYHIDGLRVDAVSSMLYLDFGRKNFSPNKQGGREDLHAVEFLRLLNREVRKKHPAALMIAEEATAFPKVTGDPEESLGFHYKWNMGWMHDALAYLQTPAAEKKHVHNRLTFPLVYAFDEDFVLPLSHDECVHGKKSFLDKMPGAYAEKFALLRAAYAYMFTHPGKKLLFMGGEFGQFIEWRFDGELDWFLDRYESHRGIHAFVKALGKLYRKNDALWADDGGWSGFSWLAADDASRNVLAYERISPNSGSRLLVLVNFSGSFYQNYRVYLPKRGKYRLILNSDEKKYFGFQQPVLAEVSAMPALYGEMPYVLDVNLPPFAALLYTEIFGEESPPQPKKIRK